MKKEMEAFVRASRPAAREEAVVQGPDYRFTVLTDRLIRLEYQPEGKFTDQSTQCVICREFPAVRFQVRQTLDTLEIITPELHLTYNKKPFSPEGLQIRLSQSFGIYGSLWSFGDEIRDLGGTARTLDQANGPVKLERGLMAKDGFSVLDDSDSAVFAPDGTLHPRETKETDLYFFGYGHDYLGCLKDFYRLSGPTPLVPRYALGNWWSRYYPYTEQTYLELMDRFRQEEIPFSTAVIDMDWHLTNIPRRCGSGWTGYTWNPDYFPNPERFLKELHDRGLHITLDLHPSEGVANHEQAYPEMARAMGIDPESGEKVPFDPTDPTFMDAYFQYLHHPNEQMGVDFWWIDWQQGSHCALPSVDPLWLLNHQHFLDNGRDGQTGLTFSRYAGVVSHRYPIGFSGDTVTSWESLNFQPYFTVTASNVGYTWWSHDIGGHMLGSRSDELTVRWEQFGVFSPIMRLHSSNSRFYGKEPWNYGVEARQIMTEFLRLRHRLIPYLYTLDYRTAQAGEPLMQPMYYRSDEPQAYQVPNEYWFGPEMLVCPITVPMDGKILLAPFQAWLPQGTYYDFFTRNVYRGGKTIALYRPLSRIPVLIPAGSILPLAGDYMTSHEANPRVLEVRVYHGANGSFTLVEDDCSGRRDAPVQNTRFVYTAGEKEAALEVCREGARVAPEDREYQVTIFGVYNPDAVWLEGRDQVQWQYNEDEKTITVRINGQPEGFVLHVAFSDSRIACQEKLPQIYEILQRAQIEYGTKDRVYDTIAWGRNIGAVLAELTRMELEPSLLGAIAEILTAEL